MDEKQRKENANKLVEAFKELAAKKRQQESIDHDITRLDRDIQQLSSEFKKTLGTNVSERHIQVKDGVLHVTKDKVYLIKPE